MQRASSSKLIRGSYRPLRSSATVLTVSRCPRCALTTNEARIQLGRPVEQSRGGVLYSQSWPLRNAYPTESAGRLFVGAVLGLVLYGAYRLASPLWVWPKPVRDELKLGMIAERRGEYTSAEAQYRKAWELARSTSAQLGDEPLLHTSGIAAHLGRMLEERWHLKEAAAVYARAFREIRGDPTASPMAQVRAAALAVRYATLTKDIETMEWAVAELLRLANVPAAGERSALDQSETEVGKLRMPSFITKIDLGAAFEQLGLLYLEREQHELAVPAFLQALSTISPTSSDLPTRCRSALLMNSLASANQSNLYSAKAWASKSLETARDAQADGKRANQRRSTVDCRECEVAALFNLASLHESEGDRYRAMKLYEESFALAKQWEFSDAIEAGQRALDRIGISQPL